MLQESFLRFLVVRCAPLILSLVTPISADIPLTFFCYFTSIMEIALFSRS
jgi:hypothetical protein